MAASRALGMNRRMLSRPGFPYRDHKGRVRKKRPLRSFFGLQRGGEDKRGKTASSKYEDVKKGRDISTEWGCMSRDPEPEYLRRGRRKEL